MTLCEALVLQFPEKVALRRDLAAMNANSAATALSKGDWAAARIGFEKAKEQFEQLVLLQPENALFRTDLARAEYNLGISFKDSDERIRHWELSRQMRRELLSKNPIPGILEKEFVKNCINLSAERQSRKEYAQALEVAFDAVKTAKAYLKDITDKPFQELLASAWILVAEASAELSQLDQAENAYCEADLVYQSLFKVDAKNYLEKAHAYSKEYMLFLTSRGKAKEAELTRLRVIESIDLVIQATPVGSPERAHFEEYRKQFEIRNDFPKTTPPKKTAPQETQAVCSHRKV
jgi:tetratricopeptide (TPR) repeat protein